MSDFFFGARIQYLPPLKGEGDRFSGGEVLILKGDDYKNEKQNIQKIIISIFSSADAYVMLGVGCTRKG